jgi:hypothetical protein
MRTLNPTGSTAYRDWKRVLLVSHWMQSVFIHRKQQYTTEPVIENSPVFDVLTPQYGKSLLFCFHSTPSFECGWRMGKFLQQPALMSQQTEGKQKFNIKSTKTNGLLHTVIGTLKNKML